MSTKRLRSAPAFFSTSALLALALLTSGCDAAGSDSPGSTPAASAGAERLGPAAENDEPPRSSSSPLALQLELPLASRPDLYLELDLTRRTLIIAARGVALDRIDLDGAWLLAPSARGAVVAALEPPLVWRVAARPAGLRPISAPATLRPFTDAPTSDVSGESTVARPTTPDRYTVPLESGWLLEVSHERPPPLLERFLHSARDGWERLCGRERPLPPRILLATSAGDAQRIYHLFRKGTAILIRAPAPDREAGTHGVRSTVVPSLRSSAHPGCTYVDTVAVTGVSQPWTSSTAPRACAR